MASDIVAATLDKHVADAKLKWAQLEAQVRTVPAGTRSGVPYARLVKRKEEAYTQWREWLRVRNTYGTGRTGADA